ncbi:MAG: ComF family protein [Ignavibacteriaceae bacterium]
MDTFEELNIWKQSKHLRLKIYFLIFKSLHFLTEILDFFLPRICPGCENKLTTFEKYVCSICLDKIKPATKNKLQLEFERKFRGKRIITGFTSLYIFEEGKVFQNIIHALKYKGRFSIGKYLGENLSVVLLDFKSEWKIDIIIPVPLHQLKKIERGYNQTFYIAKEAGRKLNIQVKQNVVKRIKFTQTQTAMNLAEREENIRGAFSIKNSTKILGKNILVIDDVITTGATISECGKVLLEAGAAKIYAASTAIAN